MDLSSRDGINIPLLKRIMQIVICLPLSRKVTEKSFPSSPAFGPTLDFRSMRDPRLNFPPSERRVLLDDSSLNE
jgi:hypothetical protein